MAARRRLCARGAVAPGAPARRALHTSAPRGLQQHTTLAGSAKDLGNGFVVRRLLPHVQRQGVGPFVFCDHFGPVRVLLARHPPLHGGAA